MDETNKKRIEVVEMRVGDIKFGFGNPRKIKKKKKEELERSIEQYGDFGLFLIDENNNAIGGNQRATTMAAQDPDRIVLCKRLIGYSEADLTTDLGLDLKELDPNDRKKKEMELINLEKYNYVLIVCKNELDYNELTRNLGIDGAIVRMGPKKKLKARAVWYHDMKAQIVSAADAGSLDQEEENQEGVEDEEG